MSWNDDERLLLYEGITYKIKHITRILALFSNVFIQSVEGKNVLRSQMYKKKSSFQVHLWHLFFEVKQLAMNYEVIYM